MFGDLLGKKINDKIFVSIASYRDPEIINTLDSLVKNCNQPQLLVVVVFEQNDKYDKSCSEISEKLKKNGCKIEIIKCHYSEAKGPYYARAIIQQKYKNEDFYLQLDSHSRFVKDWDIKMKQMLELLPEPAVITSYPLEYKRGDISLDNSKIRTGLYIQGFGPVDRFTRIQSDIIDYNKARNYPYTNKGWSACFSFSRGSIVLDAPYDPKIEYLFFGEELDIALRLYTRGYNFYSPHKNLIYTIFDRSYRNTYWVDIPKINRETIEKKSAEIIKSRINGGEDGIFSLGSVRTLKDYEDFCDIESIFDCKMKTKAKTFRRQSKRVLLK